MTFANVPFQLFECDKDELLGGTVDHAPSSVHGIVISFLSLESVELD